MDLVTIIYIYAINIVNIILNFNYNNKYINIYFLKNFILYINIFFFPYGYKLNKNICNVTNYIKK